MKTSKKNPSNLGVRPHVCETCGFSFGRKTNLIKHQRNNACPAMKKNSSNDNVTIIDASAKIAPNEESAPDETSGAIVANSEDHKFLCDQCHKSFKYRQSLQYHIESIHTDKKNFACHICGRGFTRMQRLREHSARMHGDGLVPPSHTCPECGRDFITTSAYKLHMRKFHSVIITENDINTA